MKRFVLLKLHVYRLIHKDDQHYSVYSVYSVNLKVLDFVLPRLFQIEDNKQLAIVSKLLQ